MKLIRIVVFSIIFLLACMASPVLAISYPEFPTCANPSGEVVSSYPSGTFGIAGYEGSFSGSDTVYRIDDLKTMQCFCSIDGKGIQTNWWKVSSIDPDEVNQLKADGWILIPDGSIWGLLPTTYMAKNADFSCGSSNSNNGSSSSSNNSNSSSGGTGGSVESASTAVGQVLGLADTGNELQIALLGMVAFASIISGIFVWKRDK